MLWRLQLQLQTFSHFTGKRHIKVLDIYTLLYLKWITNKDLLYGTGNSAQCYGATWVGGEFAGEWIHVCMAVSLHCPPETHNIVNGLYSNTKLKV